MIVCGGESKAPPSPFVPIYAYDVDRDSIATSAVVGPPYPMVKILDRYSTRDNDKTIILL